MNRIIAGLLIMLAPCAALAQKASTDTEQVPIEEYVPKVIIEGKWGTRPGEFGIASQFPLGHFEKYQPSSLAVDSKGNIYVLDFVNDRIQKFDKSGKYLTELPVEGMKGELAGYCDEDTCYEEPPAPGQKIKRKVMGQVEVQGINIVIDSKDNLYYYLKRNKDSKETGEVWQFRNDKLVKKMKPGEEKRSEESVSEFKQEKTASGVHVKFARNKKAQTLTITQPISMAAGEKFKVYTPMVRGDKTIIKTGTSDGKYVRKPDGTYVMEERNAVNYVLSPDGALKGKISGNLPFDIAAFDKELNGYALKTKPAGLTVIKYQLTGVTK